MWKTTENVFLVDLGEKIFHIFQRLHSIMVVPPILFRIFMDHVTILSSRPMEHLRRSFVTNIGNSWKLLLTVVTVSFVLNVTRLLDPR